MGYDIIAEALLIVEQCQEETVVIEALPSLDEIDYDDLGTTKNCVSQQNIAGGQPAEE